MLALFRWRRFGMVTLALLVTGLGLAHSSGQAGGQRSPGAVRPAGAGIPAASLPGDQLLDDPGLSSYFHPSAQYTPGVGVTVGLKATQFALGRTVKVEDRFPSGWAISGVNYSGCRDERQGGLGAAPRRRRERHPDLRGDTAGGDDRCPVVPCHGRLRE